MVVCLLEKEQRIFFNAKGKKSVRIFYGQNRSSIFTATALIDLTHCRHGVLIGG